VKALREKHFAEVGFSLPVSASARRDQRAPCRAATTQNGRLFYGGEARCAAGGIIEDASPPVHSRNVAPGQPEDWAELQKLGTGGHAYVRQINCFYLDRCGRAPARTAPPMRGSFSDPKYFSNVRQARALRA
jgi:hypothetical protein